MILLTPGPCATSDSVRAAAARPDLNHRDPAYLELVADARRRLLGCYGDSPLATDFSAYMLGGSGTAAMEAMAASCVREGPVLILVNGYYSGRLTDIFEAHAIPYDVLAWPWRDPWDLGQIEHALRSNCYEAVLGTHNETTTGRLNPVAEVGRLARRHGARMLVDAMSSFGADPVPFEEIDVLCASANKCLHGIAGLSFVLARSDLADEIREIPRRTYYLSLPLYEHDNPRLTPPVPALAAFREALREMEPGLQPVRQTLYEGRSARVRTGLQSAGLAFAVPVEAMSRTLTCAAVPEGWTFEDWFQAHREAGFLVYGCKGELAGSFYQVANMGEIPDEALDAYAEWVVDAARPR